MKKLVLINQLRQYDLYPTEDTLYLILLDRQLTQGQLSVSLSFAKSGVACRLLVIGRLAAGSSWKLETNMHHLVSKTSCQTDVFLSQADRSRVDYYGQIYIDRQAQMTKSFLKEQSLTLGQATYGRSRPILEIYNNKVQASHSASSSRLDENELFYLMSRGFKRSEAEKILEEAFFTKILYTVSDRQARQLIKDYLC